VIASAAKPEQMMMMRAISLFLVVSAFTLAGCGPDPVARNETGTLVAGDSTHPNDGSFYDEYEFRAKEGWIMVLTMVSTDVAPYLQLRMKDQGDVGMVEQSGVNGSSTLTSVASESTTYVVWANTNTAGETGAYTLMISAQPAP
jgi:hypothetical protein